MYAGGRGLEGCIPVVKTSRSKRRTYLKGCEILVTRRREKLTTGKSVHPEEETDGHRGKNGEEGKQWTRSIWKRNRNGPKTCRKCSLFFIWEMLINNGTRIPFSLMKEAQVEKLEESFEWGTLWKGPWGSTL